MKKKKHLLLIALIYLLAYAVGLLAAKLSDRTVLSYFLFDIAATFVTFVFSVLLHNSSVYDPYWSLTPMVMVIPLFLRAKAFSFWQILLLAAFLLWGLRLTLNWVSVFTDFSYEDWRYRMLRDTNPPVLWWIVNFFGIHYVPTLVVFGGMVPLFEAVKQPMDARSLPGILLILAGIALEYFADREMHAHLGSETAKSVCNSGLWHYSRHPNYLGEITVWFGVLLAVVPFVKSPLPLAVGALSILCLFNFVSIPMMEKRQLSRRADYADYKKSTARLLILPFRK